MCDNGEQFELFMSRTIFVFLEERNLVGHDALCV